MEIGVPGEIGILARYRVTVVNIQEVENVTIQNQHMVVKNVHLMVQVVA